jgi:hypothetical protein
MIFTDLQTQVKHFKITKQDARIVLEIICNSCVLINPVEKQTVQCKRNYTAPFEVDYLQSVNSIISY